MPATVIVTGLAQIQRDLARSGPEVNSAVRTGMREAAEPVAKIAQGFSLGRISRMHRSPQWAVNRVGVTRSAVFIAPKQRGVKSRNPFDPRRRPNLVGLMMDRSYKPALHAGAPLVEQSVIRVLRTVMR